MVATRRGSTQRGWPLVFRDGPRGVQHIHRTSGRLEPGDLGDQPLDRGGDLSQRGRTALQRERVIGLEIIDDTAQIISDLLAAATGRNRRTLPRAV